MPGPDEVTVVTAPREGYAREHRNVVALLETPGVDSIVVTHEGRCPKRAERAICDLEAQGRVRHVHLHRRAGANECRAAGFDLVETPYVIFLDNDASLGRGSVAPLVARAQATQASFVSPVILNGDDTIHYIGSALGFTGVNGARHLFEMRPNPRGPTGELRPHLEPWPTDAPELHGVLVHTDSLRAAGGVDRELYAAMDCLDLGLRLQHVAGGGWFEPDADVTYLRDRPRPSDWRLYVDRWSRATVEHDIRRFTESWDIDPESPTLDDHRVTMEHRRWRAIPKVRGLVRRTLGESAADRVGQVGDALMDRFSSAPPPTVAD